MPLNLTSILDRDDFNFILHCDILKSFDFELISRFNFEFYIQINFNRTLVMYYSE
jgi:hypothetical protein